MESGREVTHMLAVKTMSARDVAMREVTHIGCVGDVVLLAAKGRSGLKAYSNAALSSSAAALYRPRSQAIGQNLTFGSLTWGRLRVVECGHSYQISARAKWSFRRRPHRGAKIGLPVARTSRKARTPGKTRVVN